MKAVVQDDKVAFRHTVRILLDSVVKSAAEARSPLMSYVQPPGSQPTAARLLDTVLWLCDHELVESGGRLPIPQLASDAAARRLLSSVVSTIYEPLTCCRMGAFPLSLPRPIYARCAEEGMCDSGSWWR